MRHRFRKYLGNRGSALFMVLSTMTALMVLVMAMYFSVVSSRAVQFKVFNQEQAYRTAISISDTIVASLSKSGAFAQNGKDAAGNATSTSLIDTILEMDIGADNAITTGANGFLAFGDDGTEYDSDQIGSYSVTITRFNDEKVGSDTAQVYDFAITTSVDGVIETVHSYVTIVISNEETENGRIKNIFTSTGYVPNDVYLDGGIFRNDVFYDNEYVMIGEFSNGGEQKLFGDIIAAGSVKMGALQSDRERVVTWAFGGNFVYDGEDWSIAYKGENSKIIVGGDCTLGEVIKGGYIYVGGDLHIKKGNVNGCGSTFYVNGDVYCESDQCYALEHILYCNGTVHNHAPNAACPDGDGSTSCVDWAPTKWSFAGDKVEAPDLNYTDIQSELKALTETTTYYKWEVNDSRSKETDYIKELDEKNSAYKPLIVAFNGGDAAASIDRKGNVLSDGATDVDQVVDALQLTYVLEWQGKTCNDYFGDGKDLKYSAAVLEDFVKIYKGNNTTGGKECTLVIDTDDDPNNQYFIKCLPNIDTDGDDEKDTFCFQTTGGEKVNVIVRGQGNVVLFVPDGVTYRDQYYGVTMHESWFGILGGTIEKMGGEYIYKSDGSISTSATTVIKDYVHNCVEDCPDCKGNISVTSVERCSKKDCKGIITEIYCSEHDYTYSFCPICEAGAEPSYILSGTAENPEKEYYGICDNHVDRKKALAKAKDLSGISRECMFKDGDFVYPTCNIFLVSCDENANFMFSGDPNITSNIFVGFIYAPYMTYRGNDGQGSGNFTKFAGGMIVSDYIINQNMAYCTIFPEKLPTDLMSESCAQNPLEGVAAKDWKFEFNSY